MQVSEGKNNHSSHGLRTATAEGNTAVGDTPTGRYTRPSDRIHANL